MSYFYESGAVEITWNTLTLSEGLAEDTFITVTPNSDRVEMSAGADGIPTYSKIADKTCTIELTLKDVSPTNKLVAGIYAAQDMIGGSIPIAPFTIIDRTGNSVHMLIPEAVLTAVPEISFGRASGERTWTWVGSYMLMAEDPATITSQIASFVPSGASNVEVEGPQQP